MDEEEYDSFAHDYPDALRYAAYPAVKVSGLLAADTIIPEIWSKPLVEALNNKLIFGSYIAPPKQNRIYFSKAMSPLAWYDEGEAKRVTNEGF